MRQISIPGRYNAKVELAEIRQSEATGAYYLYMEFATDDGGRNRQAFGDGKRRTRREKRQKSLLIWANCGHTRGTSATPS